MTLSILSGKEILVTAGGTRAYFDAVRFIGNRSSGRLGSEIAAECLRRGAYVSFFHGEGAMTPRLVAQAGDSPLNDEALNRLELVEIGTVSDLSAAIEKELKESSFDAVIHAMAVLDFVPDPSSVLPGKTKSDREEWTLRLVPTLKIIDSIKKVSPDTTLVGFKLEVDISPEQLIAGAHDLMEHSGAEIVVANDLAHIQKGGYRAILVEKSEAGPEILTTETEGRPETARVLCDRLEKLLKKKTASANP